MSLNPWGWLAGSHQGLYRSDDGVRWHQVGAYPFRITCLCPSADGRELLVGVGSGAWRIPAPDARWIQLHDETLTEVLDLAMIPGDPGLVAASAYGVAVGDRDSNGVVCWQWRSDALAVNERFANAIVVDPDNVHRWLVGTEAGLLVGEEDGRRWEHTALMGTPVRAILHAQGRWWAGTDGRGVWQSQDGLSWERAGRGLDDETIFTLTKGDGVLLAGTERGVVVGDGTGRWDQVGPRGLIAAVAVCANKPSCWIAGAVPGGVWLTEDAGTSWRAPHGVPSRVEAVVAPGGES